MSQKTDLAVLVSLLVEQPAGVRVIVGIAGAPRSGKSTLAEALVQGVNQATPARAALLPMDGYHYDDGLLRELGRQERKGAADTFDVDGLAHMLARLRENTAASVAVPVFDRSIEIARAGARLIPDTSDIIVVEGNYLLLDQPPWDALAAFFDITVMIKTAPETLRDRLTNRWEGFGLAAADIQRKVEQNDLPNGKFVIENSRSADFTLQT